MNVQTDPRRVKKAAPQVVPAAAEQPIRAQFLQEDRLRALGVSLASGEVTSLYGLDAFDFQKERAEGATRDAHFRVGLHAHAAAVIAHLPHLTVLEREALVGFPPVELADQARFDGFHQHLRLLALQAELIRRLRCVGIGGGGRWQGLGRSSRSCAVRVRPVGVPGSAWA